MSLEWGWFPEIYDPKMLEDIQKVVNYFQLQPLTRVSSDEQNVSLSQEWLELIWNNDYFFTLEDVFETRYILRTGARSADEVIKIWEKNLIDNCKNTEPIQWLLKKLSRLEEIRKKYNVSKFTGEAWKWGFEGEQKRDEGDLDFVKEFKLRDLFFCDYKQVYKIPYDVLKEKREEFNDILIGKDRVYLKNGDLYWRGKLLTQDQDLLLNVIFASSNNIGDILWWDKHCGFGKIAHFTPLSDPSK